MGTIQMRASHFLQHLQQYRMLVATASTFLIALSIAGHNLDQSWSRDDTFVYAEQDFISSPKMARPLWGCHKSPAEQCKQSSNKALLANPGGVTQLADPAVTECMTNDCRLMDQQQADMMLQAAASKLKKRIIQKRSMERHHADMMLSHAASRMVER